MSKPLLTVDTLSIAIGAEEPLTILRDIGFNLAPGETLGIVGESGSGKSLLSLALMGLLPEVAKATGTIRFEDQDLLTLEEDALCRLRGNRMGMIFQEPLTALNPSMTVGDQIAEGLVWHRGLSWKAARAEALKLLDRVRLPDAANKAKAFPHELSGGQRQRVGIAIAIALKPALLIADEPTTALDVTVQADVLDLMQELVKENRMALILISHDLGVIARMCARTLVLYAGRQMEEGATRDVLTTPLNPYTAGLIRALPRRREGSHRLQPIRGSVPGFRRLPPGCCFSDRCPDRIEACTMAEPDWRMLEAGRGSRCFLTGEKRP
ncbi:ABC transporter ATP-binding protein [Rhizobium paknamense]|uniref:Peptide/nickel transport system ATP-binding protein n=1 Tax=Rhizobium paknamense TaxID=1206817 RepID=A0ABU0IG56_9HYPH|nr:ABC transporter ATP-binding protein [Rhizobium paknamense]MDQ0457230.1 peptide/nickel transport system ATP-binding protein [Rhizobium paknamense]